MKYRKKPVVIEAFKLDCNLEGRTVAYPAWFVNNILSKKIEINADNSASIYTLEGTMKANNGDFIIQGVQGEIYPCKPDIFEATYEEVE